MKTYIYGDLLSMHIQDVAVDFCLSSAYYFVRVKVDSKLSFQDILTMYRRSEPALQRIAA